jgi:hypothetical protein
MGTKSVGNKGLLAALNAGWNGSSYPEGDCFKGIMPFSNV